MIDIVSDIIGGRWFKPPSLFRCSVQWGHPRVCVITGPNGSGKSLLRKSIHNRYHERKMHYIHLSQEGRCTSSGLQRVWVYGSEEDESTGYNSVKMLLNMIRSGQQHDRPFGVMLDEPEIGCSEEVQAAIGQRLVRDLPTMPSLHGLYVITHSREVVQGLLPLNPTHWRLSDDGMTLNEFVTRSVVAADLERVIQTGRDNWHAVNAVLRAGKRGGV